MATTAPGSTRTAHSRRKRAVAPTGADIAQLLSLPQGADSTDNIVGRLAGAVLAAQEQTRRAEALLAIVERRFAATFSQSPVGIAHVGVDGRFLMVNDQFVRITGHSRAALMQHGFQKITHPDDLAADLTYVRQLLVGQTDRYVMEKRYMRPDGGSVWVNLTVALIRDDAGAPDFFVSVIEDLSEIRKAHAAAQRDPLTGLFNRRGFIERSNREMARAAKSGEMISLAYLDLDGFKGINDAHGHSAGDACLVDVARLIELVIRPGDVVGRLGGDEFAMLMPQLSSQHAKRAIERVRMALADIGKRHHWPISGSFGIVVRKPEETTDIDTLIARADAAMFQAKRSGKNCTCVART